MDKKNSLVEHWRVACCLMVLFLSVASALEADTLKFTGATGNITLNVSDADATPNYTNANAVIDPYTGVLGTNSVLLWCVDPDHEVNINDQWNVNTSYLGGNLSHTYLNNATTYGEMAWLVTQFQGANTLQKQELQAAIWLTAEGGSGDFTVNVPLSNTTFWNGVHTDMANASSNVLTSGFEILSDTRGPNSLYSKQEFMVMTPEPSGFLLLGAGLAMLVLFASKRPRTAYSEL